MEFFWSDNSTLPFCTPTQKERKKLSMLKPATYSADFERALQTHVKPVFAVLCASPLGWPPDLVPCISIAIIVNIVDRGGHG